MASGIITLTTDFGLADHYVGTMKGVIASINPDAKVVDICHQVRAYGIAEGAFTIAQSYRFFPGGTVHVVVVDPGVGTERRAIVVSAGQHHFVAPDNGVLSQVYEREFHQVREIDAEKHALQPLSRTFHGRDLFAPAAARLAMGRLPAEFGKPVTDYVRLPATAPEQIETGRWRGRVLHIDQFGNVVTSFPADLLPEGKDGFRLMVGRLEVSAYADTYGVAAEDRPFAVAGSSGYVEVSIAQGSASQDARVQVGDAVELIVNSSAASR